MFVLPWQCLETFPLVRGNPKIPCTKEQKDENATGDTPFLPTSAGRGTCLPCVSNKVDYVYPNVVVLG